MGRILPYGEAMEKRIRELHQGFENLARTYDHLNLPPAVRFSPRAHMLVHFLIDKILGRVLGVHLVIEFDDLFKINPDLFLPMPSIRLALRNERLFFTHRQDADRRLLKREVPGGYWEKCDVERNIIYQNHVVGFGQEFVFFEGNGEETLWTLFECRVNPEIIAADAMNDSVKAQVQTLVICRIRLEKKESSEEEETDGDTVDEDSSSSEQGQGRHVTLSNGHHGE